MNTNIDLARATTKSKSKTQAVSNGRVGRREEMEDSRSVPMSETSSSEQDRGKAIFKAMFNGEETYDNRTEEIH